mgnify:CR=1 FL=1
MNELAALVAMRHSVLGPAARAPVKNADLWRALDEAASRHQVQWLWVRGHAGHAENERADALARRGVEEVRRSGAAVQP